MMLNDKEGKTMLCRSASYAVALRLRGKDGRYGRTVISCFQKGGDGNDRSIGCRDEIIGRAEVTTRRARLLGCDFESVDEACDFIPSHQPAAGTRW